LSERDRIIREAERKASEIIEEARRRADGIIREAEAKWRQKQKVREEGLLKKQRERPV